MNEGEHKISVVSGILWCAEVVGGDFKNSLKVVRIKDHVTSQMKHLTRKQRVFVSRGFALLGSQAAR